MKAHRQRSDCRHGRVRWTRNEMGLLNRMLGALAILAAHFWAVFAFGAPVQAAPTQTVGTPTQTVGTPTAVVDTPTPTVVTPTLLAAQTQAIGTPTAVVTLTLRVTPTHAVGMPTQAARTSPAIVDAPAAIADASTSQGNVMAPVATVTPPLPPRAESIASTPAGAVSSSSAAVSARLPGTAHLAIQVSDSVASVGGTATSKVFVFLRDVRPGIRGFHLHLRFDPRVVQVVDIDGSAANGTQIAPAAWSADPQLAPLVVTENRVDNQAGDIWLTVMVQGDAPVSGDPAWYKVATLTWTGQSEGNSVVVVDEASHFLTPGGQRLTPDAAHSGTVFTRSRARIEGTVRLQGRIENSGALVVGSLAATRVDKAHAAPDGRFALTVSHGEGFYTLAAFAPSHLSAESDRPIKLTVGSVVDLGEVVLYAGDANGDDRIDVRDLSYVAWHLNTRDAKADMNGDGRVDILDLSLAAENLGRVGPTVWHIPAAR